MCTIILTTFFCHLNLVVLKVEEKISTIHTIGIQYYLNCSLYENSIHHMNIQKYVYIIYKLSMVLE